MNLRRLDVFVVDAGITDMRIGKGNDLPVVAGIGQDFLISRHGCVENDFGDAITIGDDRDTLEDGTDCHGKHCCGRTEEHTSELQSLKRKSYAVFFMKKQK